MCNWLSFFFMFGVRDVIKTERQHKHWTSFNVVLNISSITMVVKPENIWKLFRTKRPDNEI